MINNPFKFSSFAFLYVALILFALKPLDTHALTLCVKNAHKVNAKGRISLKRAFQVVQDGQPCPAGHTSVVDMTTLRGPQGMQGPQGATGPTGPKGLLNLYSCVVEFSTGNPCAEGMVCQTTLACGFPGTNGSRFNDILISWNFTANPYVAYVVESDALISTIGNYPSGVEVRTTSESGFGSHTPILGGFCCRP